MPTYNLAEKTNTSVYLIIRTTESDSQIEEVFKYIDSQKLLKIRVPEVVVIDGRKQVSASLRR